MSEPAPPMYRCLNCQSTTNARNLAVFIDGTSNRPGDKETNVAKLHDAISDEGHCGLQQRKFYLEGIGAGDDGSSVGRAWKSIHRKLEQALAWNVEKNVMEAYRWLARTYRKGDQIYLFGFSRGAYQVRALAGLVHEVGLVKEPRRSQVRQAYHYYHSINPNDPETRSNAMQFKRKFCRPGVRIHFVGVWDTVSSLGLVKRDVHITSSASVTNACHFRHALALDERRVKFLPEYFTEMNAHHSSIRGPRPAKIDVKEVWFAGCHSDVGGTSRPDTKGLPVLIGDGHNPVHAGNVTLAWMRQEAAVKGLDFTSDAFAWNPEDINLGRQDSMTPWYWPLECSLIRHQVSFSGTGKHKRRLHLFRPRLVIPSQHLHFSVLPGDDQMPRATLVSGVDIPTVPQDVGALWKTEPWTSELSDESTTTHLLASLLCDQRKTLASLGEALLLLDFRLENGHAQRIPIPEWLDEFIRKQSGSERFALTVIHDAISNRSTFDSEYSVLMGRARNSLKDILSTHDQLYPPGIFYFVRFSAKHERLRQHLIAHVEVIDALVVAFSRTAQTCAMESLFPLVVDSICYLIQDQDKRDYIIGQLIAPLDVALGVKFPRCLVASLTMVAILAQYPSSFAATDQLKSKILQLAKKKKGPVGSAAVKALVALRETKNVFHSVNFSNILGYLDNVLPRLDAEVGSVSTPDATLPSAPVPQVNEAGRTSLPNAAVPLPPVFQIDSSGVLDKKDVVMCKLLLAIESRDAHERTVATLTLLKLCRYPTIRAFCSKKAMDLFMKQSERKKTSLLAAYALNACLKHNMWTSDDFSRAAKSVRGMLQRCWFDDAVGRLEGSAIFRDLMTSGDVRTKVIGPNNDIVTILMKSFESGNKHRARMSLICLDIILEKDSVVKLEPCIAESLTYLENKNRGVQTKGVRILSALAQTTAGEQAIKPHVNDIVKMLLPSPDNSPIPRWKLFGPTAVLSGLCRNETLREEIQRSPHFVALKRLRHNSTLYPQN